MPPLIEKVTAEQRGRSGLRERHPRTASHPTLRQWSDTVLTKILRFDDTAAQDGADATRSH